MKYIAEGRNNMPKKNTIKKKPIKKKTVKKRSIKETYVDIWLKKEKFNPHLREALENASRYFGRGDKLTVNTLEAIYGEESSFGVLLRKRGMDGAAGHFHIQKNTAEQYGLTITKEDDPHLMDLNRYFGKPTKLSEGRVTIPIPDIVERKKFVLAAYNIGQSYIARAQQLAKEERKDPANWNDVKNFLEAAGVKPQDVRDGRKYVDDILKNELEFSQKSTADQNVKNKRPGKLEGNCVNGHWITKNHHHILICD